MVSYGAMAVDPSATSSQKHVGLPCTVRSGTDKPCFWWGAATTSRNSGPAQVKPAPTLDAAENRGAPSPPPENSGEQPIPLPEADRGPGAPDGAAVGRSAARSAHGATVGRRGPRSAEAIAGPPASGAHRSSSAVTRCAGRFWAEIQRYRLHRFRTRCFRSCPNRRPPDRQRDSKAAEITFHLLKASW